MSEEGLMFNQCYKQITGQLEQLLDETMSSAITAKRLKTDEGKDDSASWKEGKDQICLAQGTQLHIKPS